MARRDLLVWAESHLRVRRRTPRWIAPTIAGLVIVLAAALVVHRAGNRAKVWQVTRVAIRVQCPDVATCAFAASLATDVWNEQRCPGLPLDLDRGAYAFSEPESSALRDLVKRRGMALHIDFHAYGQLVLYPWGYTSSPSKDQDRFAAIGDRMASAIFATHQTRYTLMRGVELDPASGTLTDWMYGEADALSFTVELRPKGGRGS